MAASSSLLSSLVFLIALFCFGVAGQDQTIHDVGCIHLPIVHSTNVGHFSSKRGVQLALANRSDVAYYAQLSIGTPPQPVYVQLDTGSFELWVNPDCSTVSGGDAVFCDRAGRYDTAKSSTFNNIGTTKTLRYGIGSADITYVTDTITLTGSTMGLKGVQFGVANATEDAFSGILGIGYGQGIATRYPNFIDQLAAQNATKVKAYTLALGSKDEQEGVIVFGGIDTSKFAGPLAKLPVIPADMSPDMVPRFWVDMKSVSVTPPNKNNQVYANSSIPVFLDSGSTMTLLPPNLTAAIAKDFGVDAPDANGFFRLDCALTKVNGTLDFAFDGVTVRVPYKELIREVPSTPPACFLGITPSSSFALLGDTFLRSAYVVFDLENHAIWMTQAANCGSTPAALTNLSSLASVTGACGTTLSAVTNPSTSQVSTTSITSPQSSSSTPPAAEATTATTGGTQVPASGGGSVRGSVGLISSLAIMSAVVLVHFI